MKMLRNNKGEVGAVVVGGIIFLLVGLAHMSGHSNLNGNPVPVSERNQAPICNLDGCK